jgi:hypothetical protein
MTETKTQAKTDIYDISETVGDILVTFWVLGFIVCLQKIAPILI